MFKFLTNKDQLLRERKKSESIEARQKDMEATNCITFVTLAENGAIDDVTATEHTDIFSIWANGISYPAGAMRRYEGELYRCVQAHTSQADWTPDVSASLWIKVGNPAEEFPAWAQPIGSHDAYNTGDTVSHKDKKWISSIDSNIWEPGVYGWEVIE